MTINLAEVYNWVLKACHSLPLATIVECILRGTVTYLRERFQQAAVVVQSPQFVYCKKMTEIIDKISSKVTLHRVHFIGNQDYFFKVSVCDNGGVGMSSSMVTMECQFWPETNTCVCSCNKPKLLHMPCSHVYAARGKAGISGTYVSPYYLKEAVMATWSGELRGDNR